MKFFTIILLTLNTCLFGQVYQRNWPDKMLEAINAGQSDVTGTIYGDTLFHFWKEEGRYCLIDPKFYFEVIPQLHGHFRVDLYNNKAAKFGGEIIYSSFFNADSIKYKQINAPGNPTGIIDFYENGKVRLNHQFADSIETIVWQDSEGEFYESKTYVHGELKRLDFYRDTIFQGIRMTCRMQLVLPNDTIYCHLQDTQNRTWYFKQNNKRAERKIIGRDTLMTELDGNSISRKRYTLDSIYIYTTHSEISFSESKEHRSDGTGYSKYFENNQLISGTDTETNQYGIQSHTYNIVNGIRELTNTREDLAEYKTLYKNFKNGKLVSKALNEYSENGKLIKTTTWIGGKKSINLAEDYNIKNDKCGTFVHANPAQIRPVVDSLYLLHNGEEINQIDTKKLFIKTNDIWFNFDDFAAYLKTEYNHSVSKTIDGLRLELIQKNSNKKFKLYGPYTWKEIFNNPLRIQEIAYDALVINDADLKRDQIQFSIFFSLSDQLLLIE